MHGGNLDFTLDQITKIEGHASVEMKIRDGKVADLKFIIAEFKRFYTQAVRGKAVVAVPQMVARICGTCSNAHLLCSIKAIEDSQKISPSEQTQKLRRLLNAGLIIRDHGLHLYLFSLPDIYKRDSLLAFDEKNNEEHELIHDAFAVKEAGNKLGIFSGGRSVHAPSPTIDGFITLADKTKIEELIKQLEDVRPKALKAIGIFKKCNFTQEEDFAYAALQGSNSYDYLNGDIVSSDGKRIPSEEYGDHLEHTVIPYSQASGYKFDGKVYVVGALARLNLSKHLLHKKTREDAKDAIAVFPSKNIFHNNLAQAIEILDAIDDSIDILKSLTIHDDKPRSMMPKPGVGVGVIEAPRGTLFHKYSINEKGVVENAEIVVPTGQNQIAMEKSLIHLAEENPKRTEEEFSFEFEKLIRAYDPCMSCASHFLKLKMI